MVRLLAITRPLFHRGGLCWYRLGQYPVGGVIRLSSADGENAAVHPVAVFSNLSTAARRVTLRDAGEAPILGLSVVSTFIIIILSIDWPP